MASDPSKSTTSSKYDVNSQIAALLEKYFTSPTSSTRPSAVFTSGPNKGLPVSALPPSVTPFSQRGNVRRTSKVTLESLEARRQREDRARNADKMAERRRRKENERIIREQEAQARRDARARTGERLPSNYSTERSSPTTMAYGGALESGVNRGESENEIIDRLHRRRLAEIERDRRNLSARLQFLSAENEAGSQGIRDFLSGAMDRINSTTDELDSIPRYSGYLRF